MTAVSGWIIGVFVTVLGVLGLFAMARAVDTGMSIFGIGLFLFAVLFDFWIIKLVADENERLGHVSAEGAERVNLAPVTRDVDAAA
jgi:hypothetical protein